jgi:hypothetical protein
MFTESRLRPVGLVGSAGFRSLEGPTQTWVLKRILTYQRSPGTLDNIRLLTNLATQTGFELLSTSSQKLMLRALAARPDDAQLADNFRRAADRIDFRQLDQPTQTDVLHRIVDYPRDPRNVANLMSLLTTPGFENLAPDVRAQVLDGLPSRFGDVQLNPASIGNMMSLITASGFEKLRPEVRDLMLDIQAHRPDNAQLANALRNLAESPRFRHEHRMARQTILQVADSIP